MIAVSVKINVAAAVQRARASAMYAEIYGVNVLLKKSVRTVASIVQIAWNSSAKTVVLAPAVLWSARAVTHVAKTVSQFVVDVARYVLTVVSFAPNVKNVQTVLVMTSFARVAVIVELVQ